MKSKYTGKYVQAFLSDKKVKSESIETDYFNRNIETNDNESVYIYSFKGKKLLFAKGFDILNKNDDELTSIKLNSLYTSEIKNFTKEFYDRMLLFFYNNNEDLESYSNNIIIKVKKSDSLFMSNKKVFKTDDNGNLLSLIGRTKLDENLKSTDIVQYSFSGGVNEKFIEEMNQNLHYKNCISLYNIKIIEFLEEGKKIPEIAKILDKSTEKISKYINGLYKRFDINNEDELRQFAKDNFLIPNQFIGYN